MNVPNHIGIIIDGNRRWGKKHGLPAWKSHRKGAETLERCLRWCLELGIPVVSFYTLSSENLKNRSKREVKEIFNLYYKYLRKWERGEDGLLDKYQVQVRFIGDLEKLPLGLRKLIGKIMRHTAKYQRHVLNLLINYGSHFELTDAVKKIVNKALKTGRVRITKKTIEKNLSVPVPIDLIIRTGGYARLSNFLLWQAAYAEIYFTDTLWPDFSKHELIKAIKWFNSIQRNYGR
jgi:undecaprenyl diphosphate synthase